MRRLGPATLAVTLLLVAFGAGSADATWSIVGVDPDTGEVGVAVASCVGFEVTVVPIVVPGVGAGASQALLSSGSGDAFLEAMIPGADARQVIDAVISADDQPDDRQFGAVMLDGSGAGWSGATNEDVAIDQRNADQTAQPKATSSSTPKSSNQRSQHSMPARGRSLIASSPVSSPEPMPAVTAAAAIRPRPPPLFWSLFPAMLPMQRRTDSLWILTPHASVTGWPMRPSRNGWTTS